MFVVIAMGHFLKKLEEYFYWSLCLNMQCYKYKKWTLQEQESHLNVKKVLTSIQKS